jgi:hypothetical protein
MKPAGSHGVMAGGFRLFLVVGSLAILPGCLLIPVDYHAAGSRHNVDAGVRSKLQPGVTTKEEVLLMLGEPDLVSEDGQHFGYAWSKVKLIVILVAPTGGDAGEWGRNYVLHIAFDADQRVVEFGRIDSESQTWKW